MSIILLISEAVSLFAATYILFFGDWTTIVKRKIFDDYADYIIASYVISIILGWCTSPIFVIAVFKQIMNDLE